MSTLAKISIAFALLTAATLGFVRSSDATGKIQSGNMRQFAFRPGVGYYEIRDGSGVGGAWVNGTRTPMSDGTAVHGYTDRVARGETLKIDFTGAASAIRIGYGWGGADRDSLSNVTLPRTMTTTMSTNPLHDGPYSFINVSGTRNQEDIPLGSR